MLEEGRETQEIRPFVGQEEATLDKKGRLLLATKKRQRLGADFVMVLGDHENLLVYPKDVFYEMKDELKRFDRINPGRQEYARLLMSMAEDDLNCDKEGRFVVPGRLRDAAKLKEKVLIFGCDDYLEIWAAEEYAIYLKDRAGYAKQRREEFAEARKKMLGLT